MKFDNSPLYFIHTALRGNRYSLFDLATWKNGMPFNKIDFTESGKPIIKIAELNNGLSANTAYSNKEYSSEVSLKKGDFVFSWSGNPETSIDIYRYDLPDGWLNQHIFKVTPSEDIVEKEYFFYIMKYLKPNFKTIATNKQTTGLGHITISDLKRLSINIPSFKIQEKISSILKAIDDKIELNTMINKNLQQQANLLFKEKFGSYIYDANSLPKGWSVEVISNLDILVTDYVANGSFKSLADNVQYLSEETNNVLIRLTDYNNNYSSDMVYISNASYEFLEKSKLYGDEIIISNVGANVGTVFRCPRLSKRMSLAPNSIMLRSEKLEHYLYLYFTSSFGQQLLQSIVTGSAQPKFNKTNFRSLKVVVPDKDTLLAFNDLYTPMHEMLVANNIENAYLTKIRDSLLPKLMFGELDISSLNI